jgi:thioredoxin-dependent peroxiredoxin
MLKRILGLSVLVVLASGSALAQAPAQPPAIKTHLKVGDPAPDFTLPGTDGKTYKLSEFRGQKNVVLAFYVLAFTGG